MKPRWAVAARVIAQGYELLDEVVQAQLHAFGLTCQYMALVDACGGIFGPAGGTIGPWL